MFLKADVDQARINPAALWREAPVLAIVTVPGAALGRLGELSAASPVVWAMAGAAIRIRKLHDAPLPPWPGRGESGPRWVGGGSDGECGWLVPNGVLPPDLVTSNRWIRHRCHEAPGRVRGRWQSGPLRGASGSVSPATRTCRGYSVIAMTWDFDNWSAPRGSASLSTRWVFTLQPVRDGADRDQSLLRPAALKQPGREVTVLPQLGDGHFRSIASGIPLA
ncbi:hypothetical protein GCM10010214_07170 [Streptomyces abikoensis]|nr:hypothetical protein GCM10010214_07170 [Streptomyces abikoensis]